MSAARKILTPEGTLDPRELDRAMDLLVRGRITYNTWITTLEAWLSGDDITTFDFGDAESLADRIVRRYRGTTVSTSGLAAIFGAPASTVSTELARLCRRGLAERVRRGVYRIKSRSGRSTEGRTHG